MRENYAAFFGSPSAFRLDTAWLAREAEEVMQTALPPLTSALIVAAGTGCVPDTEYGFQWSLVPRPSSRIRGSTWCGTSGTPTAVEEIRNAKGPRGIVPALANQYGVSHSMISMIRAGKRWTADPMTEERFKPDRLYAMHGSVLNAIWREAGQIIGALWGGNRAGGTRRIFDFFDFENQRMPEKWGNL